jgi:1-deoxy-D-xylulose-5-phosphate synthase
MDSVPELLHRISSPADLRMLGRGSLQAVADALRAFLLDSVGRTGGHLASNLGTVELTVALHYVFDTPADRIVWDVGHQTYAHKVLTGRREAMARLRMHDGPAGFPRREESDHDSFGAGHSSTSISAALGMAAGLRHRGERRSVIAVIGDGALSAGLAYEALNNAGVSGEDLIVVLNDNAMSISPPVGAMDRLLSGLVAPAGLERGGPRSASGDSGAAAPARDAGSMFQQLGLHYAGPVDGHDVDALVAALESLRGQSGPRLLHVLTRKGQGYAPAEADPVLYHGVSRFDPAAGLPPPRPATRPTFTQVFGDWICDMAEADPRLIAITPAMREGSGLCAFAGRFPERFQDVGIAEQHAVTYAAGLACEGLKPVVAIYSTFLQRAYDQLIHDVQLQGLPVLFALDRGGLVGADGATHHGAFDLSFLRCIPGITLMTPADENECRQMLSTGFALDGPAAVRFPRGTGPGVPVTTSLERLPVGVAQTRRHGRGVALLVLGTLLDAALDVGDELDATVVNMRFVKPLDHGMVERLARSHDMLVTVEENVVMGGAGSAVAECLAGIGLGVPLLQLGLPDRFMDHGDPATLARQAGLTREGMSDAIRARLSAGVSSREVRAA